MAYVYMTHQHPGSYVSLPIYNIKGDSIYRTHHHPAGYTAVPVMVIRDNSIHMTRKYPAKYIAAPIYEIKDDSIYMTLQHPDAYTASKVMEIKRPASSVLPAALMITPDVVIDYILNSELKELDVAFDAGADDQKG
jgi:hypothetical protein